MPPQELTLRHFVLQQEVLNLYRQAIRATRREQPPSLVPRVCSCRNVLTALFFI